MLSLHSLPSSKGRKRKRYGRGNASKGNYAGRGLKGQRSRSGGRGGLKLQGLKQSMLAIPKSRGFNSMHPAAQVVNLNKLEKYFEAGEAVGVEELMKKGLIENKRKPVKILGTGKLTKKLTITVHSASKKAQEAIEKAGGTFESIKKK